MIVMMMLLLLKFINKLILLQRFDLTLCNYSRLGRPQNIDKFSGQQNSGNGVIQENY